MVLDFDLYVGGVTRGFISRGIALTVDRLYLYLIPVVRVDVEPIAGFVFGKVYAVIYEVIDALVFAAYDKAGISAF